MRRVGASLSQAIAFSLVCMRRHQRTARAFRNLCRSYPRHCRPACSAIGTPRIAINVSPTPVPRRLFSLMPRTLNRRAPAGPTAIVPRFSALIAQPTRRPEPRVEERSVDFTSAFSAADAAVRHQLRRQFHLSALHRATALYLSHSLVVLSSQSFIYALIWVNLPFPIR